MQNYGLLKIFGGILSLLRAIQSFMCLCPLHDFPKV